MLNNTQQNSTFQDYGLTKSQHDAAVLLIQGYSKKEVAEKLNVDRGTLYNWYKKLNFSLYYNSLYNEILRESESKLVSLFSKSFQVIEGALDSDDTRIKTKTAFWLLDKFESKKMRISSLKEEIKRQVRKPDIEWTPFVINEKKLNKLCKENNISPEQIDLSS